jgi:hypothetical protein
MRRMMGSLTSYSKAGQIESLRSAVNLTRTPKPLMWQAVPHDWHIETEKRPRPCRRQRQRSDGLEPPKPVVAVKRRLCKSALTSSRTRPERIRGTVAPALPPSILGLPLAPFLPPPVYGAGYFLLLIGLPRRRRVRHSISTLKFCVENPA